LRFTASGLGWLVAAALIGALAWYKSINMVLIVVYSMIMLLVLNGLLAWGAVRRVSAARLPVPPVFAGEQVDCGVKVTNTARRPATVAVEDRAGEKSNTFLVYRLPGGQSLGCAAARTFRTRGRFGGPVAISSGFPFGFLECERPGELGGEVIVLPPPGYAEPDGLRRWIIHAAGSEGWARRVLRRVTTDHAEVRGVRPYRAGDAIRDVHWRSTARRGELVVREYDMAPSPELVLVVEPWVPPDATQADRDRLEAALSLAVTIALTWRRAYNSPVTVAVPGHGTATASEEEDLRAALAPLADVVGSSASEPIVGESFSRHLASSARVVVSSRPNTPFAAVLGRTTGKPFIGVSPADRIPWYLPPNKLRSSRVQESQVTSSRPGARPEVPGAPSSKSK
jgi:uncharacterized protein (DUF58 family)